MAWRISVELLCALRFFFLYLLPSYSHSVCSHIQWAEENNAPKMDCAICFLVLLFSFVGYYIRKVKTCSIQPNSTALRIGNSNNNNKTAQKSRWIFLFFCISINLRSRIKNWKLAQTQNRRERERKPERKKNVGQKFTEFVKHAKIPTAISIEWSDSHISESHKLQPYVMCIVCILSSRHRRDRERSCCQSDRKRSTTIKHVFINYVCASCLPCVCRTLSWVEWHGSAVTKNNDDMWIDDEAVFLRRFASFSAVDVQHDSTIHIFLFITISIYCFIFHSICWFFPLARSLALTLKCDNKSLLVVIIDCVK